ncbi:MAG: hypothetical protein WBS33_00490, partial [Verrucomicrobiia bacterium]
MGLPPVDPAQAEVKVGGRPKLERPENDEHCDMEHPECHNDNQGLAGCSLFGGYLCSGLLPLLPKEKMSDCKSRHLRPLALRN